MGQILTQLADSPAAVAPGLWIAPAGWVGICLVFLGLLLFSLDIKVTNHGLPTALAVLVILGGGWLVVEAENIRSPVALIALGVVAIGMGAGSFGLLRAVHAAKKLPVVTGAEAMIGEVGVVKEPVGVESPGWVLVHGERWQAILARTAEDVYGQGEEPVAGVGQKVMVIGLESGKVVVLPLD